MRVAQLPFVQMKGRPACMQAVLEFDLVGASKTDFLPQISFCLILWYDLHFRRSNSDPYIQDPIYRVLHIGFSIYMGAYIGTLCRGLLCIGTLYRVPIDRNPISMYIWGSVYRPPIYGAPIYRAQYIIYTYLGALYTYIGLSIGAIYIDTLYRTFIYRAPYIGFRYIEALYIGPHIERLVSISGFVHFSFVFSYVWRWSICRVCFYIGILYCIMQSLSDMLYYHLFQFSICKLLDNILFVLFHYCSVVCDCPLFMFLVLNLDVSFLILLTRGLGQSPGT